MKAIDIIEKKHQKESVPEFNVGDRVKVSLSVKEGDKTRTQIFEGTVIRRKGKGIRESFSVLKAAKGSSHTVEKTFPMHSPIVENVTVVAAKKVRRSKLYYMRAKKK